MWLVLKRNGEVQQVSAGRFSVEADGPLWKAKLQTGDRVFRFEPNSFRFEEYIPHLKEWRDVGLYKE